MVTFPIRIRSRRLRNTRQLHLRELEDRTVPVAPTIIWDGGGNSFDWNKAANWSDAVTHVDRLPGPNDDVEIGAAFSAITVSSASDVTIQSLTSYANLEISGSGFLLATDSHLFGKLSIQSATFSGSGTTTVDGAFDWYAGILTGTGSLVANGGTVVGVRPNVLYPQLSGGFRYVNGAGQTATLSDQGPVWLREHSTFENAGTLVIPEGFAIQSVDATGSAFVNAATGVVQRTGGTGIGVLLPNVIRNDGRIEVETGALWLGYVGSTQTTNNGELVGDPGTTLVVFGDLDSPGKIDGDQVVFWRDATVSGPYSANATEVESAVRMMGPVAGLGALTVSSGGLDLTAATLSPAAKTLTSLDLSHGSLVTDDDLSVARTFRWSGGTLQGVGGFGSLTAGGGTTIFGNVFSTESLRGGIRLINPIGQTAEWGGGSQIDLIEGSTFENAGTFDIQVDGFLSSSDNSSDFLNTGTLVKSVGSLTSPYGSVLSPRLLINRGTIEVLSNSGVLTLGYDNALVTNTESGVITGQSGTTIGFLSSLTSSGRIEGDLVWFGAVSSAPVEVSGSFQANRTRVSGNHASDPYVFMSATILGLGKAEVGGNLNLRGAVFSGSASTLTSLALAGTLVTDGHLSVAGPLAWSGGTLQGVAGQGSLRALGATTITGGVVRDLQLTNAGTMDWTAGNLSFFGPASSFTNAIGATFDDQVDGVFGSGDSNSQVFNNEGLFIKSGGDGTTFLRMQLVNSGFIDVRRGTLDITNYIPNGGGGSGPISAPIDNGGPGRSDPGPGPQPVYTSFRQRASGSLTVTIRGLAAGSQYGQISVNGSVQLDGTLKVNMNPLSGYTPAVGQTFAIINNQATDPIVGTFANPAPGTMLWDMTHRYGFDISYTTAFGSDGIANDIVLTLVVANSAPRANAGGPYSISEGSSLRLDASGSSDPDGDTLTYSWDVNGDGTFGDATGVSPTLTWAQLQALGIDDGPHSFNVQVRVDDGNSHIVDSVAAPLTLENTAPTATLSGGGSVTYGQSISASFGSPFDPSAADTTAGFHYAFSIDDGGSGLATATYAGTTGDVSHSYSGLGAGTHTIYARIIDKDDGHTQYSTSVTIDPATPAFSVTNTTIVTVGTPSVTLTGSLLAGSLVPTGSVTITLAGAGSQVAAIGQDGSFSATFLTANLPVGAHDVKFDYIGDANFNAAAASGTLDDSYGVRALVQKSKDKKKGASLSVQVELLNASGQNVSSANIVVTAVGIGAAAAGDVEGDVGAIDPSQLGSLNTTLSDSFNFHGGANPSYSYSPTNLTGLTAGQTYRLYFQVAGDPLLHWVAFTL